MSARIPRLLLALVLACTTLLSEEAWAHAEGEDYVVLKFLEGSVEGHFEVHFDDLREKLGIELPDGDEAAALTAVEATADEVHAYIRANFSIAPEEGAPFALEFTRRELIDLPQGRFAQYYFRFDADPLPTRFDIVHEMFYAGDRLHRGLVLLEYNAKLDEEYPPEYTAMVFSPSNQEQTLDLEDVGSLMGPRQMVEQGVWHIWIGIDHILFLLALMLPTVLTRREAGDEGRSGGWEPIERFPKAFWNLLKIVTVFTVSHSLTLVLAALDFISVPSQLVESIIALSIVLVALNNVFGKVREGSLLVILVLGLFHGLGFASVMGHLPFRMVDLLPIVIGFNVGVELGQLVIVAVVFPVLYGLRRTGIYQPLVLKGGSIALALVAGYWFVQRAFGLG